MSKDYKDLGVEVIMFPKIINSYYKISNNLVEIDDEDDIAPIIGVVTDNRKTLSELENSMSRYHVFDNYYLSNALFSGVDNNGFLTFESVSKGEYPIVFEVATPTIMIESY